MRSSKTTCVPIGHAIDKRGASGIVQSSGVVDVATFDRYVCRIFRVMQY